MPKVMATELMSFVEAPVVLTSRPIKIGEMIKPSEFETAQMARAAGSDPPAVVAITVATMVGGGRHVAHNKPASNGDSSARISRMMSHPSSGANRKDSTRQKTTE